MHALFCGQILCTCHWRIAAVCFRHVIVKYMIKKKKWRTISFGGRSVVRNTGERRRVMWRWWFLGNKNNYIRLLRRTLRPLGLGVAVRLAVVAYRHHGDGDVFVGHTGDPVVAASVATTAAVAVAAATVDVKHRTGLEQCRLFVDHRLPVGLGPHGQLVPGNHSHRSHRVADTLDKHTIHTSFRTRTIQDGQKGSTNTPLKVISVYGHAIRVRLG